MSEYFWAAFILCSSSVPVATLPLDSSWFTHGPIAMNSTPSSVTVQWKDENARSWNASFSLDSAKPLIASIDVEGRNMVSNAHPFDRCETGKHRDEWDALFDFPRVYPASTSSFLSEFHPKSAQVRSTGNDTQEFGKRTFQWRVDAKDWKGAHLGIWDVAGNRAFTNPIWCSHETPGTKLST